MASVADLMASATIHTGLDDFGSDHFLPVFEAWAQDIDHQPLTDFGRKFATRQAVRNLSMRLRVMDCLKRNPEIDEVELPPVILITGSVRSGTTLLHNLMALPDLVRPLLRWELTQPIPPPQAATYTTDARIQQVQAALEPLRGTPLEQMHWVEATDPEECTWGMVDGTGLMGVGLAACMPTWMAARQEADHVPVFAEYQRLLKLLLWKNPPGPGEVLLLKNPADAPHLGSFMEVFPDAHVVLTPRDPFRTVVSACRISDIIATGIADGSPFGRGPDAAESMLQGQLAAFEQMVEAVQQDPERVSVVAYPDLMEDPAGVVARVFTHAGVEPGEDLAERIDRWLVDQRAHRAAPPGQYDDYGLDADDIRSRPAAAAFMQVFGLGQEAVRITAPA